ncbi:MAG: MBL fold metallo-hydrolase [Thermomicrobiales bacterium]
MRLTRDVGLVGGGDTGFNLSHPLDCHIYVIDGGDELALIDAGIGGPFGESESVLTTIADDGYDLDRFGKLILTHYHADHAGGAFDFKHHLGLTVLGSPLTARTLVAGDEAPISLAFAKAAGLYPATYEFRACPAEPALVNGQPFSVGRLTVTPFDTPGHCRGHVSLLIEGGDRTYLIAGDLVFHGGTIIAQNIPDCSIQEYSESTRKMAGLEFHALLPGHFTISLRNGKRHIDLAAAQFNKLMIPRNAL